MASPNNVSLRKRPHIPSSASPPSDAPASKDNLTPQSPEGTKAAKVLGPQALLDPVSSTTDRCLLSLVTVLALVTRFYHLDEPSEVVFDEVHFGKFASYYLRRTYYFDVHPPLAKLMLAAMGYFLGYDGHYDFDTIGGDYLKANVPYVGLRTLPAALGAFIVPFVYLIMRHSGFAKASASVAASFVLFDNALVAQSRLILLDSILMFFMIVCIYCWVRFYKLRHREYSCEWWSWLVGTGVFMALTMSVKMVGLFLVMLIGVATLIDLWRLLDIAKGLTMGQFMRHFRARAFGLILVPIVIYLFIFWVHFAVLIYSGPGDAFMSSSFQRTLHGNSMQTLAIDISYGDQITIKHKDTRVFLHSHVNRYPLRYDDGRVSSQGQQVTGYPHNDANNYWQIVPGDGNPWSPDNGKKVKVKVKHKDIVRLLHVSTESYLLTHDVASPLTPTNQEFTTVKDEVDGKRYNETLFEVDIDGATEGHTFQTAADLFRLVHVPTRVALWSHPKVLPEWAFKQQEVNGNKNLKDRTTLWSVNEIMGVNATEVNKDKLSKTNAVESKNFFSKFFELQSLMITHNAGLTKPHPYSSHPIVWPLLIRGISFWTHDKTRRQIYMIGNPFGWWIALMASVALAGVMLGDFVAGRRGLDLMGGVLRNRLYRSGGFLFLGWLFHYLPFFLMGRMLFLHHYLPALILNYMVAAVFFQFVFVPSIEFPVSPLPPGQTRLVAQCESGKTAVLAASFLIGLQAITFWFLAPVTYSTPGLDVGGVLGRKLLSSWDFHFAK